MASDFESKARESEAVETQALDEWQVAVRAMDPGLTSDQLVELREDLVTWVQQMIARHGMESALVLYPEQAGARAEEFFRQLEQTGFTGLPDRDERVSTLRQKALYLFLRNPTAVQRAYLANLMSTGYLMAVFTIDPDAAEVVRNLTKGQRVYLDTNLVYDLLSLRGPRKHLTIRRTLEHTRQLGYEVCVTPWTIAEMKFSVRKAREELARTSLPPRALADLAAEAAGDQGYLTAYWRKYKETGVKPEDFFDLHEQIEGLLEKAGIRVEHEGCTAVSRDEDGLAEQVGLLATIPGGSSKPPPVLEHDAKHRLLVERLRGEGIRRFSNAGYWFLTRDSTLMPYASERRETSRHLPFAVSLAAWTHIVRSLSPRTADYEQTLVDLLDTPSVRPDGVVSPATVAEILGRVEMLAKDSTEEIATRMLLDGAVMGEAAKRNGERRNRFVREAVQEKRAELAREIQETREAAERDRQARDNAARTAAEREQRLKQERRRRSEAEHRLRELERNADTDRARGIAELEARDRMVAEAQESRAEVEAQHAAEVAGLTARLSKNEKRVEAQEIRFQRLMAAVFVFAAVLIVAVPTATGWITDGIELAGAITAGLISLLAAVAWIVGRTRAGKIAGTFALVLGVFAGIYTLVTADDPDTVVPQSPARD